MNCFLLLYRDKGKEIIFRLILQRFFITFNYQIHKRISLRISIEK